MVDDQTDTTAHAMHAVPHRRRLQPGLALTLSLAWCLVVWLGLLYLFSDVL